MYCTLINVNDVTDVYCTLNMQLFTLYNNLLAAPGPGGPQPCTPASSYSGPETE